MDQVSFSPWHFVHLLVVLHSHCSFNAYLFTDHTQPSIVSKFWLTNKQLHLHSGKKSQHVLITLTVLTQTYLFLYTYPYPVPHQDLGLVAWHSSKVQLILVDKWTAALSEKNTVSVTKITMKPRMEKDNHHILSRQYHVGLLRFCSGHNRLNNCMMQQQNGAIVPLPVPLLPREQDSWAHPAEVSELLVLVRSWWRLIGQWKPLADQVQQPLAGPGENSLICQVVHTVLVIGGWQEKRKRKKEKKEPPSQKTTTHAKNSNTELHLQSHTQKESHHKNKLLITVLTQPYLYAHDPLGAT